MRGGHMNEAFVDFTGGVGEVLYLRQDTLGLFSTLRHALAKESLVGATALSDRGEYRTEDGLVKGHAYSVTGTHKVSLGFTNVHLMWLWSPRRRVEWPGAWSDSCPRWDALPAEWRDALLVKKEDGEFWEIDDVIGADLRALMVPYIPLELEMEQLFHEPTGEATFDKFDEDASGTMNSYELRLALNAAGFHLTNQLTQALTSRYRDSRLRVDFGHFASCMAQLISIFRECHPWHWPLQPAPGWWRGGRLPDPQTGEPGLQGGVARECQESPASCLLFPLAQWMEVATF
eukprot:bmy_13245T0